MIDLNATLIAQIINFLLLVIILTKVAYKPLVRMLEERQQTIAKNLESAQQEKLAAEQLKREYQEQLNKARVEAQAIVDKAVKLAEETKEEIIREAKAEHARMLKAAQDEINREREQALADLRAQVASLSLAAAAKIIEKNLDAETNSKLVHNFIDNLDQEKIGGLPC